MSNDLDTRARAAATAVHDAVRHLPADRVPGRTRTPWGRIGLVTAAIVAVLAIGAAVLGQGGDEGTPVATDGEGDIPRLVLGEIPAGLAVTGAADLPLPGDTSPTSWVYGDADADEPFAERDLGVVQLDGELAEQLEPDAGSALQIDGRPAEYAEEAGSATGRSLVVQVPDGAVVLSSGSLDRAALEAAARDLDLDDLAEAPPTLAGLDLVGEGQLGISMNLMVGPSERGHMIGYQDEDGTRSLTVTTAAGDDGDLASLQWQLGQEAEAVDVDGTTGWVGEPYGPGSASLTWPRADGVIVTLSGTGFEVDDLVEVASLLREAMDEEWDPLLEETGRLVPSDALAGVSFDDEMDGQTYGVYIDTDRYLCTAGVGGGSADSECSGLSGEPVQAQTVRLGSGRVLLIVYTTLDTTGRVDLQLDGAPTGGVHSATTEDGTLLAVTLSDTEVPTEVQVVDAAGTKLGQAPVAAPLAEPGSVAQSFSGTTTEITAGG